MKKLLIGVSLVLALALVLLWAIGYGTKQRAVGTIVDDLGRTVNIDRIPQRILSLAPSNTEILFALGLGDKVVGVTDFCDYPEEAKSKPKVGAPFPGFNLETIVSLKPDLVLSIAGSVVEQLEQLGLTVVVLQAEDMDGILRDIELVGRITGKEEWSNTITQKIRERTSQIESIAVAAENKPKVFFGVDVSNPSQLWTAGSGTFIDAFITLAGGENIAADVAGWLTFSLEELVNSNPDVIILGGAQWGVSAQEVSSREVWRDLEAVKQGRIYAINDDLLVRPGPRVLQGLEDLARLLHPELFSQQ